MFFFSFSTQNRSESYGSYSKQSLLDPNCAKLNKIRNLDMSGTTKANQGGKVSVMSRSVTEHVKFVAHPDRQTWTDLDTERPTMSVIAL